MNQEQISHDVGQLVILKSIQCELKYFFLNQLIFLHINVQSTYPSEHLVENLPPPFTVAFIIACIKNSKKTTLHIKFFIVKICSFHLTLKQHIYDTS